ncbi:MAG: aminotransferase class I/II-fold pyridoxal phosphate-dependent enzyme [Candidatus Parvarchaeota archaeon]
MKKSHVEKRLVEIEQLKTFAVEGACYAFPSYKAKIKSTELAKTLLNEYQVAILPGIAFGNSGEGHFRISFAGSIETIGLDIDALGGFLTSRT